MERLVFKGEKIDTCLLSCVSSVGSVSACAQPDDNYRHDHQSSLSTTQPKTVWGRVVAGDKLWFCLQFKSALSRFMPRGLLSFAVWPELPGEVFRVIISMHFHRPLLLTDGDAQEENERRSRARNHGT